MITLKFKNQIRNFKNKLNIYKRQTFCGNFVTIINVIKSTFTCTHVRIITVNTTTTTKFHNCHQNEYQYNNNA